MLSELGWQLYDATESVRAWAAAANTTAQRLASDPMIAARNLRHGRTWFVGVDALPTGPDGAIEGVKLTGPWQSDIPQLESWNKAQLSIIYQGYPKQDENQSDTNHRYRVNRCAAHVDGLLPVGPTRRRFPLEFHAFVLGIPLNRSKGSPTVAWEGSHHIIRKALARAIGDKPPRDVDVTEAYHSARREVFETCRTIELQANPGEAFLLHRFTLHGTAPWTVENEPERRIAFFRPEFPTPEQWLDAP